MAKNDPVKTATVIVKFVGSEKEYEYFMTNEIFQSDFDQRSSTRYFKITNDKGYTYGTPVQFVRYNFKPTIMAVRTIVTAVEMERDGYTTNGFVTKNRVGNTAPKMTNATLTEKELDKSQYMREVIKNNQRFLVNDIEFNITFESWETIVHWKDGESTSVICRGKVDQDAGIALCFMKRATGNKFASILSEYGEEQ